MIEKIDENDGLDKVYAQIIVEKEIQKRMIVGNKGEGVKRVGMSARKVMQHFAQKKIYLDLRVTGRKGWSKNKESLEEIGYLF